MPGMNGHDAVRENKKDIDFSKKLTILMLSSTFNSEDRNIEQKLGIARHLTRPIRRAMLHQTILETFQPPGTMTATPFAKSEHSAPPRKRTVRLLLVEDNSVNQKLEMRVLEKMGHQVSLAVNGRQAIEMVEVQSFDLILMDIQMPVMGGVEATRMIRASANRSAASADCGDDSERHDRRRGKISGGRYGRLYLKTNSRGRAEGGAGQICGQQPRATRSVWIRSVKRR